MGLRANLTAGEILEQVLKAFVIAPEQQSLESKLKSASLVNEAGRFAFSKVIGCCPKPVLFWVWACLCY